MIKIYISASLQELNGTPYYGTEEDNMFELKNLVLALFATDSRFLVKTNLKTWSLYQTIQDCNDFAPDFAIDLHSNAGGGTGFEFLCLPSGQAEVLASNMMFYYVNNISLANRGIKYRYNLGFLNDINAPSIIIENFFHDNVSDVNYYFGHKQLFAQTIHDGILRFVNASPVITPPVEPPVDNSDPTEVIIDEIIEELKQVFNNANDGMLRVSMIQCDTLEHTRNAYKLIRDLSGCMLKIREDA